MGQSTITLCLAIFQRTILLVICFFLSSSVHFCRLCVVVNYHRIYFVDLVSNGNVSDRKSNTNQSTGTAKTNESVELGFGDASSQKLEVIYQTTLNNLNNNSHLQKNHMKNDQ